MKVSTSVAKAFLRGEEEASQEVYQAYRKLLYFVIASIVGSKEDAEDVYQDTFVAVLTNRNQVKSPKDLEWYLLQTAKNLALNAVRKRDALIDYSSTLDLYGEEEKKNDYLQELNQFLNDRENIVVTLKIAYGFTNKEAGKILDVSEREVALIYHQALKKLRKGITNHVE